jgi:hypothetical protein
MRPAIVVVLLAVFQCPASFAQQGPSSPVRDVSVCDLIQNPQTFDRQLVRFRGRLHLGFESAHVGTSECAPTPLRTGIWWTYGGDNLPVLERERKQIQSFVSPIQHDAAFDTFEQYAHLRRYLRPDNNDCSYEQCKYYDVVATFSGRFFSGSSVPWRKGLGGFGHMGCCHLFVIEQISEVTAKRTAVPADDTPYSCTSVTWQAEFPPLQTPQLDVHDAISARAAANKKFLSDQIHQHDGAVFDQALDSEQSYPYLGLAGPFTWSSPDLLTTYEVQFPSAPRSKKKSTQPPPQDSPIRVNVAREHCEPVTK